MQPSSLDDVSSLADDLARVAGPLPEDWCTDEDDMDCTVFADARSRPRVLFVSNRGGRPLRGAVRVPARMSFVDALTRESLRATEDGYLEVELSGYRVRMLVIV